VTYGLPYTPSFFYESSPVKRVYHRAIYWLFSLMPWNPLVKAILDMASATNTDVMPGIRWAERDSYCTATPPGEHDGYDPATTWRDFACVFPVGQCLVALALQFLCYTALAVWLDNVLPNALGVSRSPLFFLHRAFWRPRPAEQGEALARLVAEGEARAAALKMSAKANTRLSVAGGPDEDEDVGEESARLKLSLGSKLNGALKAEQSEWLGLGKGRPGGGAAAARGVRRRSSASGAGSSGGGGGGGGAPHDAAHQRQWQVIREHVPSSNLDYAVEVFGLQKVFRLSWWAKNMPRWLGGSPAGRDFWAIKDSWFGIEQGSLFCLLGPNGAGKTTTINCLTGGGLEQKPGTPEVDPQWRWQRLTVYPTAARV
jgi:ABC-type multidrug transport system fused ATPase/permease subunit